MQFAARPLAYFALASFLSLSSVAQAAPGSGQTSSQTSSQDSTAQTPAQNPPPARTPADKTGKEKEKDKEKEKAAAGTEGKAPAAPGATSPEATSKDRLFYALPNFLSLEHGGNLPPLTVKQKFGVVARGSFDPVQYGWWGFLSAIGQANNSEPGFGQGWAAYGKRYGTTAADGIIENFMTSAVLPSILHQDPRFFQSGKGGFGHRTVYAVSRIFITRTDSGHSQFNYSEIVGSALSAAISTYSYHPRSTYLSTPTNPHMFVGSDRTLENTASVWGTQVGYDTVTIVIKEFWPDIHRKFSHRNSHKEPVVLGPTVPDPAKP
jgi:hypothetical protein